MKTIVEVLFEHAKNTPDKVGLIVNGEEITYKDMVNRTVAVAKYFNDLGVEKASSVILSADASSAFVYGYFACHLLSSICVPVDPRCSEQRLNFIVDKMKPRAVFTSKGSQVAGVYSKHVKELLNCPMRKCKLDSFLPLSLDTIADVLFTSGTTGDAKGVVLTQRAIATAASHINKFIGNSATDREVMPLPLSHSFGLGRLRCNVLSGATIILVPGFGNPALIYQALDKYRGSGLASVPAGFAILLKLDSERLGLCAAQLNYIEIGSSPMALEHKELLCKLLPKTRICMHYGLTEASRSVFIEFHRDNSHLDSIGKPSPGVDVRIVGEQGEDCKHGESGRILVRGKHCTVGYWDNKALTDNVLVDDWLVTGDFGFQDSDGYLYLLARESDIINVGGMKVAPAEVEQQIITHPAVSDCACVGIPDPRNITGMVVKAFLVPANQGLEIPPEKELDNLLRGKMESYKLPFSYEWIESIPKTESGKIKRSELQNR